ncbi:MAG: efflux transporter periplasmic adaptor subunit [Rhodospirillaceae bacterium]|nr:efflux transporter periplasmic adaptor subunit [Rhodospirillaceae bacterium]
MSKTLGRLTFINLVVALVGLLLVLCPSKSYSQSQNLNLGPVDPGQILGELKSRQSTILSSEISARIKQITRREGYSFKKGDVLIRLDCSLIRAKHNKTLASLVAAKRKYEVEKRLLQLNSTGELDVQNAEAEVEKKLADKQADLAQLSKCIIRAPFSGRIVERKAGEHQFAQIGKEILSIIDDKNLEIAFIVPSRWITWLKPGYKFVYRVNETGKSYPSKVVQRGAQVDAVSRSVVIIGETLSRYNELVPGMSGQVIINPPNAN